MAQRHLITVFSTTQPKECGPASKGFFIASWPDAEHDSPLLMLHPPYLPAPGVSLTI